MRPMSAISHSGNSFILDKIVRETRTVNAVIPPPLQTGERKSGAILAIRLVLEPVPGVRECVVQGRARFRTRTAPVWDQQPLRGTTEGSWHRVHIEQPQ